VPAARLENVVAMGQDKQHARMTISSGGAKARTVAFRTTAAALGKLGDDPHHVAVTLEVNEWNGSVEPRLILKAACPPNRGHCEVVGERPMWDQFAAELKANPKDWVATPRPAVQHDIDRELSSPDPFAKGAPASAAGRAVIETRALIDRRGHGISAVCGELLAAGESVLAVCADARRRADGLAALVAGIALDETAFAAIGWPDLVADQSPAGAFRHIVLIDPPPVAELVQVALKAPASGGVYLGWGSAETAFAQTIVESELDLRPQLTALFRLLRESDAKGATGESLEAVLRGDGRYPRPGRVAARLVRVLTQLRLASFDVAERSLRIEPDAPRTELERSTAYTAYSERLAQARAYLASAAVQDAAVAA
jgi:single-stranded-DNA-specific exonuclease